MKINIVLAYFLVNIKTLMKDKISLIWSIVLPTIFMLTNQANIHNLLDVRYYWAYIIFNSYIFGIGIHAIRQREFGTLKTFFSIKDSRWEFFWANVFTQICFIELTLIIFNLFITLTTGFSFIKMMVLSSVLLFLMLPIAFLSFIISIFEKIHVNTLSSILTMLIMICLLALGVQKPINCINPLYYASNILLIDKGMEVLIYSIISVLSIAGGCWSIKNYSAASNEVR